MKNKDEKRKRERKKEKRLEKMRKNDYNKREEMIK